MDSTADNGKKKQRSRQYPAHPLPSAVDSLKKVSAGLGYSPASKESIATALGYSGVNGASAPKIAALVYFDLLEASTKGALKISDTGKRILLPRDNQDLSDALITATKSPKLYRQLFDRFAGSGLPSMLPNILARDFGILPQQSQSVSDDFKISAEFAGLLVNGVLSEQPIQSSEQPIQPSEQSEQSSDTSAHTSYQPHANKADTLVSNSNQEVLPDADPALKKNSRDEHPPSTRKHVTYTIPLTKGRKSYLQLPDGPLEDSDIKRIANWLELFKEVLTENEIPDISAN